MLAYYYHYTLNDNTMCVATLDMMEKYMPRAIVPSDYRILYDVGNLYQACGAPDKFKQVSKDLIPIALANMNDVSVEDLQSQYNPYSILERVYINLKEYDKAIDILQKLQNVVPQEGGVQDEINRIKVLIQTDTAKK
jgi:tetratricopeptide (TPR) repeat protein